MRQPNQQSQTERGQSIVEIAISFIFLAMLLVAIIDLGRALFTFLALRDAAQEGAIYATYEPDDSAGIEERIRTSSTTPINFVGNTDIQIDITYAGAHCFGNGVLVEVTYPNYPLITPFMETILGSDTIPIRAEISDTILRPPCH